MLAEKVVARGKKVVVIVLGKDALFLGVGVKKQPRAHPGGASAITDSLGNNAFNQSEASGYSPVKGITCKKNSEKKSIRWTKINS